MNFLKKGVVTRYAIAASRHPLKAMPLQPYRVHRRLLALRLQTCGGGARHACGLLPVAPLIVSRGMKSSETGSRHALGDMFRTASWLVYGARWFTASGFERSAQGFDPRDDQVIACG